MAKMNWEKVNRSKKSPKGVRVKTVRKISAILNEQIRENKKKNKRSIVKPKLKMATPKQTSVIRKYNMVSVTKISSLTKKDATKIISKYAREHGWKN